MAEQMIVRTRDETRYEIARRLRREFAAQPMAMICDDGKLLLLSELVLRVAEGRA